MIGLCTLPAQARQAPKAVDPALYKDLRWQWVGPFQGGQVVAVADVNNNRSVYYRGATGGGVSKTDHAGITWLPISDRHFRIGPVGAIAVADSDPNTIYVGMGEACLRANVSQGGGVYQTTDSGRTWKNVGSRDSQSVGQIRNVSIWPASPGGRPDGYGDEVPLSGDISHCVFTVRAQHHLR